MWSSLSTDTTKKHNNDLIKSGEMDVNKELNFWFDHHVVIDKRKSKKYLFCALPDSKVLTTFLTKNPKIKYSSSTPCCAIQFPPKFVAYFIFFEVTQQVKAYDRICLNTELFSINLQEEDIKPNNKHRKYLINFITKQQKKYAKIYDVFNDTVLVNDIQDMMGNYKQLVHQYSLEYIDKDVYSKKDNDDY